MKLASSTFITATLLLQLSASAGLAPENSELRVDDDFEGESLGDGWHINTGSWQVVGGVLQGKEIEADNHSAAARRIVATDNAVYEVKFRFTGEGQSFHLGFDPARGELDKKGHLFSVIITPESWKIMKHVDKNQPEEDPNENLSQEAATFTTGEWYELRVTTWGPYVTAHINGEERKLDAFHSTFNVKKPTVVFRCIGDGVELDDLKVWNQVQ